MVDESYSFTAARARLDEIVTQVRKKDTSLEKSLDLLEEGVRLANICTEQIDHADWTAGAIAGLGVEGDTDGLGDAAVVEQEEPAAGEVGDVVVETVVEEVAITDENGDVVAEILEVAEYVSVSEDQTAFSDADDVWADEAPPADVADAQDDARS